MIELELARKSEIEYCKNNMEYFIETYIHIEDVDNKENILQKFKLWQKQKEVLTSIHNNRLNIILKARQLGVTWLVLAYSCYLLLFNVGYLIIALSKTEEDAKELIRRLTVMLNNMKMFIKEDTKENENWKGLKYRVTALSIEILHNGKSSVFKAFSSSKNAGRSFTANLLILDEWAFQQFAREIWLSSYPTINRPTGGKVIGLSTIDNGAILCGGSSHPYIHLIECYDKDRFEYIQEILKEINMQRYMTTYEQFKMIDGCLVSFEREYCGSTTKKGKRLIKEPFTRRIM